MAGDRELGTIPLSRTTKFIVDNRGRTAPTVEGGIPLIATNCISNDQLYPAYEKLRYVSRETYDHWFRSHPEPGDIILTNKGSQNGAICLVPDPVDFVIAQDMVALRADESVIAPRFLFAALRSADVQRQIKSLDVSGVIPHLKKSDFDKLHLPYPARTVQEAIGRIYFDFCAKIELNRRMNATLDAMVRSLFQSWFVDFDPVRAKLDGRQPAGLDPTTAALFPASFQDSPIGPVPKGWKVERFDAHITADRGLSYKGEGLRDDCAGLPMHNLNSVYEGGGYKHEGLKYYAGEYREKHLLEPGDMIVTNTEQGFDHLLIGHAAIVPRCHGPKGLFSHHIYRVRHKPTSPFSPHYLVELFNNHRWHYWISGFSNGTTINMLPMDALEMPMLVVPPVELVEKFTAIAEAAHLQVEDNIQQSRTLATLRDTLLPKLLSGALSVTGNTADSPASA
jgi:type I restriction enzyme S subunit